MYVHMYVCMDMPSRKYENFGNQELFHNKFIKSLMSALVI